MTTSIICNLLCVRTLLKTKISCKNEMAYLCKLHCTKSQMSSNVRKVLSMVCILMFPRIWYGIASRPCSCDIVQRHLNVKMLIRVTLSIGRRQSPIMAQMTKTFYREYLVTHIPCPSVITDSLWLKAKAGCSVM